MAENISKSEDNYTLKYRKMISRGTILICFWQIDELGVILKHALDYSHAYRVNLAYNVASEHPRLSTGGLVIPFQTRFLPAIHCILCWVRSHL